MANANPIKLVAFDLGGVLTRVDKEALTSNLGVSRHLIETAFFDPQLFDALMHGRILPSFYFSRIAIALSCSPKDLENAFRKMIKPGSHCKRLISRLKAPYTFWSNTNQCHFEHFIQSSDVFRSFSSEHRALSFELAVSKPSSIFFEACLHKSRLQASEIMFLDDKDENVRMAHRFGIQGFTVRTQRDVFAALSSANLL